MGDPRLMEVMVREILFNIVIRECARVADDDLLLRVFNNRGRPAKRRTPIQQHPLVGVLKANKSP